MKTDLFQSCGHCWNFQIFWHTECSTLTRSSFRIWNSSAGIPSPPLVLFVAMLPNAHLTSHSRMPGSRSVTTPSQPSGYYKLFYRVLLSILATSYWSLLLLFGPCHFCPLLCLSLHETALLVSPIFLKRSLVFPILSFSSISLHCSLKKAFLSLLPILWNSAFSWLYLSLSPVPFTSILFSAICKTSSENHFVFLYFLFLGMVLVTTYCTMVWTPIHTSLGTLQTSSSPLNLFTTSPA